MDYASKEATRLAVSSRWAVRRWRYAVEAACHVVGPTRDGRLRTCSWSWWLKPTRIGGGKPLAQIDQTLVASTPPLFLSALLPPVLLPRRGVVSDSDVVFLACPSVATTKPHERNECQQHHCRRLRDQHVESQQQRHSEEQQHRSDAGAGLQRHEEVVGKLWCWCFCFVERPTLWCWQHWSESEQRREEEAGVELGGDRITRPRALHLLLFRGRRTGGRRAGRKKGKRDNINVYYTHGCG